MKSGEHTFEGRVARLRDKADEIRATVDSEYRDPGCRKTVLGIARQYDELADQLARLRTPR